MADADAAIIRTIVPTEQFFREEIGKGLIVGKLFPGGKDGPNVECLRKLPGGQTWSDFIFLEAEGDDRVMAIPDIRLPANQYWPMHWHDCWTMVLVLEGSCLLGDWWMYEGDIFITGPSLEYGPLVIGPDGCRMFEVFADRSLARGGYGPEYHDHPTLKGISAVFNERSEANKRNEGNQILSLKDLPEFATSRLTPGMTWSLGDDSDPERSVMRDRRLQPGERVPAHSFRDTNCWVVLGGSLTIDGRTLERDGYLMASRDAKVSEIVVGPYGAHVLEFARTLPGLDPISA